MKCEQYFLKKRNNKLIALLQKERNYPAPIKIIFEEAKTENA